MAVFRVEKNKNYTVMSNYHLRDTWLSLKSKGLLSLMLSLPENDSICARVKELEVNGYVIRRRIRNEKGQLTITEYTILEEPQPKRENPVLDNPILENPEQDKPILENPGQLNTKELNTDISYKDQSIYQAAEASLQGHEDRIDAIKVHQDILKKNTQYDALLLHGYDKNILNEILALVLDTISSRKKNIRIGGEEIGTDLVKCRLLKPNQFHMEYIFDCMKRNTTKIHNIRSYLLTALYNAPSTINHYYQAEVAHDISSNQS